MKDRIGISPAALAAAHAGNVDNFFAAVMPGGIEAQERAEQIRSTATFDRLPKDGPWDAMKALGFKVLGDLDDIFYRVEAPAGWTIRASDHAMWSYVHDDKGRLRASVFYKGAFYDRRASFHLERRYDARHTYEGPFFAYVRDTTQPEDAAPLFKTAELPEVTGARDDARWDAEGALDKEAKAWLAEHFPQHRDPTAYWE